MIWYRKLWLFLFVVMLIPAGPKNLLAQNGNEFIFDRITSENIILRKGLSQNTIYCLMEDSQGYLWFGSWDGLNKYDGYNFTIYNKQNGLSNETINALAEDEYGRIWIGTDNGLNCLDKRTGNITIYQAIPGDSSTLSGSWINYLRLNKSGQILICTNNGLNILNYKTGIITKYQNSQLRLRSSRRNNVNCILNDNRNNYWAGTNFGLLKYDPVTHENIRFLNRPGDFESLSSNVVNVIMQDRDQRIWIGTDFGLNLIDESEGKFKVFLNDSKRPGSIGNNNITDIFEDSRGTFWIATDGGGLNILDRNSGKFKAIKNNPKNPYSLGNNRVYDICEDRSGNLWFGTFKGVSKISKHNNKFGLFTQDPDNPNSLNDNFIWAFCEIEPGIFWVGTDNGINVFDKNTNTFTAISRKPGGLNSLSSLRIRCILKDSSGKIWIGLRDAGLDKFDPVSGKFTNFMPSLQDRNSLSDIFVLSLFEDNSGKIWVGTNNGLNMINPKTNQFRPVFHNADDSTSLSDNTIYDINQDAQGVIWLATNNGLCRYNRESDNFSTFIISTQNQGKGVSDKLFCVFEDSQKDLWVGTRGGGIAKFDRESGTFVTFTTDMGLPNNVVYCIQEDEQNNLWLSTNWGLSRFNKKERTFINYDVTDGIQSNEFNSGASLKSRDGEMFFGGMRGFNAFYPGEIKINTAKPQIVITAFKKFNITQPGDILDGDTIILAHDENFFSFEFSSLDFTNPSKNRYSFILENYNNDWTNVDGNRHYAEYTKVNPGKYTFRVKGSNNNGVWNNEGISLTIIIKQPWYSTWFFRICAILVLFASVHSTIHFRFSITRKKHEMEKKVLQIQKQLIEIQQKALRLQMNPHFFFNSLNSIQSFVLSNDVDLAVHYLGKFSQLMRMILSNSAESIIPLADELQAVKLYLEIEKLRFDDKFTYSINVDPKIDEEFTGIPPMIIQPYIENAIIHGLVHKETEGHINIKFTKSNDFILCTIQDDGIGRQKAMEIKKQSGLNNRPKGMLITKERLEILNQGSNQKYSVKVTDLTDDNHNSTGTRVELVILFQEI